jgi:hypothetical protein
MDVAPPRGDLAMQVGNAVDDRHRIYSSHGGIEHSPRPRPRIGRSQGIGQAKAAAALLAY